MVLAGLAALLFRLVSRERTLLEDPTASPHRPSPHRPGICFCSHHAHQGYPFQHLFLKLTPRDPAWALRQPDLFAHRDQAGFPYATLGAGPKEGLGPWNSTAGPTDPVSFEAEVPSAGLDQENARIAALLEAAARCPRDLAFTAWTGVSGRGYNCNSGMRALLSEAGTPLAAFALIFLRCPRIKMKCPFPTS